MSNITEIIMVGSLSDDEEKALDKLIHECVSFEIDYDKLKHSQYKIKDCSIHASGDKGFGADIFLLSANYFEIDKFLEGVEKIRKESIFHLRVQIFIREDHQEIFYDIFK